MKKTNAGRSRPAAEGKAILQPAAARKKKTVAGKGASLSVAKKSGASNSAAKKLAPKTVDEYMATTPQPAHDALDTMRKAIRSVMPLEATEVISYKIPAFRHKKILVWYAAFARHCSLFPTKAVLEQFKNELKGFATSKGTVQFPLNGPVPVALIKKLVRARVERG